MNKRVIFPLLTALTILVWALVGLTAPSANAETVDEYSTVRQTFCSTTDLSIDISFLNEYGNTVNRSNTWLDGESKNGVTCINRDITAGEYGQYVSTSIYADNGGYVYCAIWDDGVKIAEASDNSSYFSSAFCY